MPTKSLSEVAEMMRDIDICTLSTITADGGIAARPMSNNREVDFDGDAWFFTMEDSHLVPEIAANPQVGVTYQGAGAIKALFGRHGPYIHVAARAELIRDRARFAAHWHTSLDAWFDQGIDTPGLVLVHARARSIHVWDGMDSFEVGLRASA